MAIEAVNSGLQCFICKKKAGPGVWMYPKSRTFGVLVCGKCIAKAAKMIERGHASAIEKKEGE